MESKRRLRIKMQGRTLVSVGQTQRTSSCREVRVEKVHGTKREPLGLGISEGRVL